MKPVNEIGQGKEFVYLYYFKEDKSPSDRFPCKIGKAKNDYHKRIKNQQASMKQEPIIGLLIRTDNSSRDERLIHTLLNDYKLDTFGSEWFNTTPEEVMSLYNGAIKSLSLGLQIKELRLKSNLTQTQFAEKTGLRQATVSDIENDRSCTLDTIEKCLNFFDKRLLIVDKTEK